MMKKTLLAATVAASLIVPASAGIYIPPKPAIVKAENLELSKHMLLAMPLTLGIVAPSAKVQSVIYLGTSTTITGSTSISGSFNVGATDAGKEVFVVFTTNALGTGGTMSATTFGGATATKATSEYPGTNNADYAACWYAKLPTQSGSQTFTLTFSVAGALLAGNMYVFVVLNRTGSGNQSSGFASNGSSATTQSISTVAIPNGGFWLGAISKVNTTAYTAPTAPTGLIADVSGSGWWMGHTGFLATGSTPTSTWSWTTNSTSVRAAWAFA